jgi:hypothetical protein
MRFILKYFPYGNKILARNNGETGKELKISVIIGKCKFVLVHTIKAYRGSSSIPSHILNFGITLI